MPIRFPWSRGPSAAQRAMAERIDAITERMDDAYHNQQYGEAARHAGVLADLHKGVFKRGERNVYLNLRRTFLNAQRDQEAERMGKFRARLNRQVQMRKATDAAHVEANTFHQFLEEEGPQLMGELHDHMDAHPEHFDALRRTVPNLAGAIDDLDGRALVRATRDLHLRRFQQAVEEDDHAGAVRFGRLLQKTYDPSNPIYMHLQQQIKEHGWESNKQKTIGLLRYLGSWFSPAAWREWNERRRNPDGEDGEPMPVIGVRGRGVRRLPGGPAGGGGPGEDHFDPDAIADRAFRDAGADPEAMLHVLERWLGPDAHIDPAARRLRAPRPADEPDEDLLRRYEPPRHDPDAPP